MRIQTLSRPFRWLLDRAAAILDKARVPASLLTLAGFTFCLIAGIFFGVGRFTAAGLAMIPAALCDLLARPLAHRQPRMDFFSAFLKSILHRYADLAIFLGLLVYYATVNRFLYALVTGFAMAGAVMVSYSQARAESLIERCRVGFWERPERLGLMILGALVNRVPIALFILAIGSNLTVIHRIWHTWNQTEGRSRAAARELDRAPIQAASPLQPAVLPFAASPLEAHEEPQAESHVDNRLPDLLARAAKRGA
ncbi:MAG: CDP-alcohol phosphatidyltransferase family protein [Candidatus Acidiferrales bacterium]